MRDEKPISNTTDHLTCIICQVYPCICPADRQDALQQQSARFDAAPHPWRIEEPNKRYFRIVDASGKPICDFFPEATWSPGREIMLAVAQRIVRLANSAVLQSGEVLPADR